MKQKAMTSDEFREKYVKLTHKQLVAGALDYLSGVGCTAWANDTGVQCVRDPHDGKWITGAAYGTTGVPDILGWLPGARALAVEVKVGKDTLRKGQKEFRDKAKADGVLWMLCEHTVASIEAALEAAMKEPPERSYDDHVLANADEPREETDRE